MTWLVACDAPTPERAPKDEIRLSRLTTTRLVEGRTVAVVRAETAVIDTTARTAILTDIDVELPGPKLSLTAPEAVLQLDQGHLSGSGGVTVAGPGYTLAGERYAMNPWDETLKVKGGVHATGSLGE